MPRTSTTTTTTPFRRTTYNSAQSDVTFLCNKFMQVVTKKEPAVSRTCEQLRLKLNSSDSLLQEQTIKRNPESPDSFSSYPIPSPLSSSSWLSDCGNRDDLGYGTCSSHGSRGNSPHYSCGGSPSLPLSHSDLEPIHYTSLLPYNFPGEADLGLDVSTFDPSPTSSSTIAATNSLSDLTDSSSINTTSTTFTINNNSSSSNNMFTVSGIFADSVSANGGYGCSVDPVTSLGYGNFQTDSYPNPSQTSLPDVADPVCKQEPLYPGGASGFPDLGVFWDDESIATFGSIDNGDVACNWLDSYVTAGEADLDIVNLDSFL
jgi:hypothetical protein